MCNKLSLPYIILQSSTAFEYIQYVLLLKWLFNESLPNKALVCIRLGNVLCSNTERFWNLSDEFGKNSGVVAMSGKRVGWI